MVSSDALAVQSQGYQGPKVSNPKVVLGSQKNDLGSQEMFDIVDTVDIFDIVDYVDIFSNLEQC